MSEYAWIIPGHDESAWFFDYARICVNIPNLPEWFALYVPIQGFIQAVLLISVFWTKIEFSNVVKSSWGCQGAASSTIDS